MGRGSNKARRDAVRLLLFTLLALGLCAGAAALSFAPLRPDGTWPADPMPALDGATRVNLNQADLQALCCLPGIGAARAMEIITYREQYGPFGSVLELSRVEGIDLLTIVHWGNMAYTMEEDAEGF